MNLASFDELAETKRLRREHMLRTVLVFRRQARELALDRGIRAKLRGLRIEELPPVDELETRRWRIYAADGEFLGTKRTRVVFDACGRYVGLETEAVS